MVASALKRTSVEPRMPEIGTPILKPQNELKEFQGLELGAKMSR